jgi:hypothetical protein
MNIAPQATQILSTAIGEVIPELGVGGHSRLPMIVGWQGVSSSKRSSHPIRTAVRAAQPHSNATSDWISAALIQLSCCEGVYCLNNGLFDVV